MFTNNVSILILLDYLFLSPFNFKTDPQDEMVSILILLDYLFLLAPGFTQSVLGDGLNPYFTGLSILMRPRNDG